MKIHNCPTQIKKYSYYYLNNWKNKAYNKYYFN